jgi:ribosome-associated translation inhibitor RaiA
LKIRISDDSGARKGDLHAHVQRRLDFALSGFQQRIGSVTVRLSRVELDQASKSTPKSKSKGATARKAAAGVQRCEIEVKLRPRVVGVEDTDSDLIVAIDNATARLARSIARALDHDGAGHAVDQALPAALVLPAVARRRRG